jgi:hypothetical protein
VAGNAIKSAKNRLEGAINSLFFPKKFLSVKPKVDDLIQKKHNPQKALFCGVPF